VSDLQVRDLVDRLKAQPQEGRLRLVVECVNSTFADADSFDVRLGDDGVYKLCILGAQVSPFAVAEGEGG
jgi:hypothetical protein